MARESCNLGKDEAEILRPSSPSPSSSSSSSSPSSSSSSPQNPSSPSPTPSQPVAQQQASCLLLKASQDFLGQRSERPEIVAAVSSLIKSEEVSRQPAFCGHRCSACRKRVGLTGFRCRCGDLFCGRHRYSDTHDCSFDYKAAGREEISKANPVIRAAKIIKI